MNDVDVARDAENKGSILPFDDTWGTSILGKLDIICDTSSVNTHKKGKYLSKAHDNGRQKITFSIQVEFREGTRVTELCYGACGGRSNIHKQLVAS